MSERPTPYDVVFRGGAIDFDARFEDARAEAEARGMDVDDPDRFVMLGAVGSLLRDMILAEDAADDAGELWQALPPDAIAQAGALLYQAYRFRDAGGHVYTIDEPTARAFAGAGQASAEGVVTAPAAGGEGSDAGTTDVADAGPATVAPPPAGRVAAGYVQLPRNLFWARPDEDAAAEPLDGFFFARGWRFDLLFALGVRPRRPGITAIPIAIDLDSGAALARWADTRARDADAGDDFANILPGGEKLLGVTSAAEAVRLAALALRYLGIDPSHG